MIGIPAVIYRNRKKLHKKSFTKKFGTAITGLELLYGQDIPYYYVFLLLRRFIVVFIIFLPFAQLQMTAFSSLLFGYFIWWNQPF